MQNRKEIVKSVGFIALLKSFGLTMPTIKYMALIAEHDSGAYHNVEAELMFGRVVKMCEEPEMYDNMRKRLSSKLEVVAEDE